MYSMQFLIFTFFKNLVCIYKYIYIYTHNPFTQDKIVVILKLKFNN